MRKVLYILGQLDDQDVDWLSEAGERRQVNAGDILIQERKPCDEILIILDGTLSVTIEKLGEVAQLNAGEIVGEMSLVDSRPPSATVTAAESSTVLSISKNMIQEKLEIDIGFAARFYHALAIFLSSRMRGTVQKLGYGSDDDSIDELDEDVEAEDELDLNVLDNIHLAGARFDRMLKKLMGTE